MTEIVKMLEHLGNFKDIARAHLLGKILETILPVVEGRRKISGESFEHNVALAGRDRTTQADLGSIGHRYEDQRMSRCQPECVESERDHRELTLLVVFGYAETALGINYCLPH